MEYEDRNEAERTEAVLPNRVHNENYTRIHPPKDLYVPEIY